MDFHTTKKDIINKRSESEILFRGIKTSSGNQTAKLKSIEGLTTWVLDEAEELTDEKTFDVIKQSIRKKGIHNRIILILNPKSNEHWIYKRFFELPGVDPSFNGQVDNIQYIYTTYLENLENLSSEFIDEADKCKRLTPAVYNYEYLGHWTLSIEGAIFPITSLNRYSELNDEGETVAYIDTADEGKDHYACVIGRIFNGKYYVLDAVYNLHNLTINEEIIKERFAKWGVSTCYIETNAAGAYHKRQLQSQNLQIRFIGEFSKSNKMGRILAQMGRILYLFYFPKEPTEELERFITALARLTSDSKEKDDSADALAGMSARLKRDHFI